MEEVGVLLALHEIYGIMPFQLLLVGFCTLVASWFPHLKDRYALSFWVGLGAAFGGGILSSLFLQDPEVGNPLLTVNEVGVTWALSWWAMNYFPYGMVAKLHSLWPIQVVSKTCLCILRAGLIAKVTSFAVKKYAGVIAAPLFLGAVAGTGGKLIVDTVMTASGLATAPGELTVPSYALRSGFLSTLLYYLTVHVYSLISPAEGKALITTILIYQVVASDFLGAAADWTLPFEKIFHALTNIPQPGASPDAKLGKKAQKAKPSASASTNATVEAKKTK